MDRRAPQLISLDETSTDGPTDRSEPVITQCADRGPWPLSQAAV
jgi:hypothetical protein